MKNIKYVSLKRFLKRAKEILDKVMREEVDYIVMVEKEPRIRISSITDEQGKEFVFESEFDAKELKDFIKD